MQEIKIENRQALPKYFNELGFKKGAEIGVAAGDFSLALCEAIPNLILVCVDPWTKYNGNRRGGSQEHQEENFDIAYHRLKKFNVHFIKEKSMDALEWVPDEALDFVFIDGNHDYRYVKDDIREWSKKVRKGGIISGHDYYKMKCGGVVEAVNEYVKENDIELHLTGVDPTSLDDKKPSFYWFKK